ncbi:hypothetical protein KIW84_055197 [Lathyrus oleraceus]|uniref:Uncharacterized protein n=1 Tax=Pisum sativum TaxID=3888 RepID=A0A9D4WXC8_PEA|nr:hypothetical protein KIW84_055197 [Pisum sativum]
MIASKGHHLGNITPSTLAFPGLIMGLCQKACVSLLFVVHETIDGEVNDGYIERHCVPRKECVINAHAPPAQHQVFDERVVIREPHVDHSLGTRDKYRAHANWPEGKPFQPEGAVDLEVETTRETYEEESEKGESMSD